MLSICGHIADFRYDRDRGRFSLGCAVRRPNRPRRGRQARWAQKVCTTFRGGAM
jgi:hypothetical protein